MSGKTKRLCAFLAAGLLLPSLLSGCTPAETADEVPPLSEAAEYAPVGTDEETGFDIVAQNGSYTLMFSPYTCALKLRDAAGFVWDSNPSELELTSVPSEAVQNSYRSQVTLQYYDKREKPTTLESYADAVAKSQFTVYSLPDGVRVVYSMGVIDDQVFPNVMSQATVAELRQKLDETTLARVLRFYDEISLDSLTDSLKNEYIKTYPLLEKESLYVARKVHDNIKEELSGYLKEAGFDKAWMYAQYDHIGMSYTVTEDVLFAVPVDYTLTDEGLKATCSAGNIEYNRSAYKLSTLSLLPYFGSANESDTGWMLIPDGSGALVDLQTVSEKATELTVYGYDYTTYAFDEDMSYGRQTVLPVYGIQKNGHAMAAMIDEGAEIATLNCQSGGSVYPRDAISPIFALRGRYELASAAAGTSSRIVYGKKTYSSPITVTFHPLGTETGYSAMAKWVQSRLFGDRTAAVDRAPFFLETVGAVERQERFLSYKVMRTRSLTTFAQAAELIKQLGAGGVTDIALRYDNWQGDRYYQTVTDGQRPASVLGGASGLKTLLAAMPEGWRLYLDSDPLLRRSQSFHGMQSVLNINGRILRYYGTLSATTGIYANPASIEKTFARFTRALNTYAGTGASLSMVGTTLYTEASDSRYRDRTAMASLIADQLAGLPEDRPVLLNGGNSYVLPYADCLLNVSASHSNRVTERESVPFLQMVLHGRVCYAGEPLNTASNYETALLRSVEYGESPYYLINYAPPAELKNTEYSALYSTYYADWTDRMMQDFAARKDLLAAVHGVGMTGHDTLAEGVYRTTYANGVTVLVNYTDSAVQADGQTVSARGFVWTQKGGDPS